MKTRILFSLFASLIAAGATAQPAATTPTLESRRAASDPALTADPDTPFWKGMPSVALDRHIITGEKMPHLSAEVRSRWTDKNLYFLFVGKYPARNTKPETDTTTETYRLWLWDCFEAYVDNIDNPPHQYRELQMSPNGEWLDLAIDSTVERAGGHDERYWDSGMKVQARIDDSNKMWIGEIQVPWTAFMSRPPKIGDAIRVNFYRQDGAGRPARGVGDPGRTFMAWQPTGAWNPHHPDNFGVLKLVGD